MEPAISSEDLGAVTARMALLLKEYKHYDLTTDILAAWSYYLNRYYRESVFSCTSDIGTVDEEGHYHPQPFRPDFTIRFPDFNYALIAEVKASLSVAEQSLRNLKTQVDNYCSDLHFIRDEPSTSTPVRPDQQDILLIIPANAATAAAAFLRKRLSAPPGNQHIAVCQFECKDDSTRVLFFNTFPLQTQFEGLRDSFFPANRRISFHLNKRVELRVEAFELQRKYIIAGNDGMLSNLGVLIKVLEAAKDTFSCQLRRDRYGDIVDPPPLKFSLDKLYSVLKAPPYECSLRRRELRELLSVFSCNAPYFDLEKSSLDIRYSLRKSRRFYPFKKEDVTRNLTAEYAGSGQLLFAFHLACGLLIKERLELRREAEERYQLSLPFEGLSQ